jgi:SPP1 gp7 family putative phage head morphogenesis protein
MTPDLAYACKLPPAKAIQYLRDKGYKITWRWEEMWQEAHADAFTVAKCTRLDVLQDIRSAVDAAIAEGITFAEFRKQLEPTLRAKGWWGKVPAATVEGAPASATGDVMLGSPYRLRTIYDTNVQTAYMAGRYKAQIDNAEDRPFWEYISVIDKRTSMRCADLNGKVFRSDDPFWNSFYPPNHWHCRARVRARNQQEVTRLNISVDDSAGKLSTEDRLVSKATGETAPVTVYTDSATGQKVAPDPGWSYNPGKAKWKPDLKKYDDDIAALYKE